VRPFLMPYKMSLLMYKFLEDKIQIYQFNIQHYEEKITSVKETDSMYEFYCERLVQSQLWLDVLYTARDAKADNPYSK
jgi:hypothetical protein